MSETLQPYPQYKDSGLPWLGPVPAHWGVRRAKYLMRELDTRTADDNEVLFSVSQYSGVTRRRLREGSDDPDTRASSLIGYKVATAGDLIINIMLAWNGSLGIAPLRGVVSPAYCVYRFHEGNPWFFHHLLRAPAYKAEIRRRSRGVVDSRLRLYTDDLYRLPLLVPNTTEQQGIVRFVRDFDNKINRFIRNRRRLIEVLNEQKQAIINRAVTRGLNPNVPLKPSGIDWLGDIPEHWETWRIGHFARVGNGSTPSRAKLAYWQDGEYPWLNSGAVNRGTIKEADQFVTTMALKECHLPRVEPGSVLIAITGQGKTRGTAGILGMQATISQHLAYVTSRTGRVAVNPEYLRAFLTAAYSELRRMSDDSGSTKGALTCDDLRHFQVAVPPVHEQQAIVVRIANDTQDIEAALQTAHREIDLICEYRTRLIADVVTGKVDVRGFAPTELPLDDEQIDEGVDDEEMLGDDEPEIVKEIDA